MTATNWNLILFIGLESISIALGTTLAKSKPECAREVYWCFLGWGLLVASSWHQASHALSSMAPPGQNALPWHLPLRACQGRGVFWFKFLYLDTTGSYNEVTDLCGSECRAQRESSLSRGALWEYPPTVSFRSEYFCVEGCRYSWSHLV